MKKLNKRMVVIVMTIILIVLIYYIYANNQANALDYKNIVNPDDTNPTNGSLQDPTTMMPIDPVLEQPVNEPFVLNATPFPY